MPEPSKPAPPVKRYEPVSVEITPEMIQHPRKGAFLEGYKRDMKKLAEDFAAECERMSRV